jgi:hypothetical protein
VLHGVRDGATCMARFFGLCKMVRGGGEAPVHFPTTCRAIQSGASASRRSWPCFTSRIIRQCTYTFGTWYCQSVIRVQAENHTRKIVESEKFLIQSRVRTVTTHRLQNIRNPVQVISVLKFHDRDCYSLNPLHATYPQLESAKAMYPNHKSIFTAAD